MGLVGRLPQVGPVGERAPYAADPTGATCSTAEKQS
jgi:hypothetical protein